MTLLLDTHTFIWWDSEPSKLSSLALAALLDPANEVWCSVASIWEMAIKAQLGKLSLRMPLANIIAEQQSNGLHVLPINLAHALAVEMLPQAHKDPFDRLLAAQAHTESATLVTADTVFQQYPVALLW